MFYVLLCVCPFLFCNHLEGKERASCLALFFFLVSRDCCVALTHSVMGLSALCDCGISGIYSLTFYNKKSVRFPNTLYFSLFTNTNLLNYSQACVKRPLSKDIKIAFQDQSSLNARRKYCRMLRFIA